MIQVQSGQESEGIKLFGTTIKLHGSEDEEKRPDKMIACPRCKSMETKFCYFNNYNVNQPRHFCKGCQRYWTAGGALRNVPVGAGRRKSKPPCHTPTHQFSLDEWHFTTILHGDFHHHLFPSKRRRTSSAQHEQVCHHNI